MATFIRKLLKLTVSSLSCYNLSPSILEYIGGVGREFAKKVGDVSIIIDFTPLNYKRQGFILYLD